MSQWIYLALIYRISIVPSLGQKVQFSLQEENYTFRRLKIERLVVEDSVYLLPPDSSTFLLNLRLPTRIGVEFKTGWIEFQVSYQKTYCEDASIHIKLHQLSRKRYYNYYQIDCSSIRIVGPLLRRKRYKYNRGK
jgi:hypothetical protein